MLLATGKDKVALKRELSHLVTQGECTNLPGGFYLITPPRCARMGRLRIQLYIHKLLQYLAKPYYLGFY